MKRLLLLGLVVALMSCSRPASAQERGGDVDRTIELNRGIQLLSAGQYDEAEQTFAALANQAPEQRVYRYYLGIAQIKVAENLEAPGAKYREAADNLGKVLAGLRRGTPDHDAFASAHLDHGVALLMAADERAANRTLRTFVEQTPSDAGVMLLGIAQYRCGEYRGAIESLEPLTADPEGDYYGYAEYYVGLAQAASGQLEAARGTLQRVRQLPFEFGQRAQDVLDQLEGVEEGAAAEPFNFWLTVEAGNFYDSNVVLLGRRTRPTDPISSKDDYRFGLLVDADLDWRPAEGALEGWHFNIGATVYDSWHASIGEFNVQNYSGRAYIGRTVYKNTEGFVNEAEVGIRYDYDYSLVGNDGFLSRNGLALVGQLFEKDYRWRTTLEYQWQIRDYEEEIYSREFDRDGNYQSIQIFQDFDVWEAPENWRYKFSPNQLRWLTLTVGYRHDNNSTQGDEFDFTANSMFAGARVPLPWHLEFATVAEFEWQDYWQKSLIDFDRRPREDFIQRYTFELGYRFNEMLTISGEIAWTYDDSNVYDRLGQEVFSYDRVVYGLKARVALLNPHRKVLK